MLCLPEEPELAFPVPVNMLRLSSLLTGTENRATCHTAGGPQPSDSPAVPAALSSFCEHPEPRALTTAVQVAAACHLL